MPYITKDIDIELNEFDTDDLIDELEGRGYEIKKKKEDFILKRFFDRHELREHLLRIAECGAYVSDEELLNKLRNKLQK